MGSKLSPPDEELYRRVDEVLHYIWDPIGVSGAPMARDEYYSYIPAVFSLLKKNVDREQIAAHLNEIVTKRMGLKENHDDALGVADILLEWKESIAEKFS